MCNSERRSVYTESWMEYCDYECDHMENTILDYDGNMIIGVQCDIQDEVKGHGYHYVLGKEDFPANCPQRRGN